MRCRFSSAMSGREVVLDPVDPLTRRVAGTDLGEEREVVQATPARPEPDPEPVGVHVVGTGSRSSKKRPFLGRFRGPVFAKGKFRAVFTGFGAH